MASLGLSEREQAGCRQILELLETEELLALTDTVTNRLVHPENRQGVRIPLRRAAFRPVAPISERGSGRLPSCLSAAEGVAEPGPVRSPWPLVGGGTRHSGGGGTGPGLAERGCRWFGSIASWAASVPAAPAFVLLQVFFSLLIYLFE